MEERFEWNQSGFGKTSAFASVDDSVRVEHPLLKVPLSVPVSEVRAVARVRTVREEPPLLVRDPRIVTLTTPIFHENVLVLLSKPTSLGPFKYGAEKSLSIRRKERKTSVEIDAVGLSLDNADGFVDSLRRRGVRTYDDPDRMLLTEIGPPAIYDVPERLAQRRRAMRNGGLKLVAFGALFSALVAVRMSGGARITAGAIAALAAASVAWAVVAGAVVARFLGRREPREVRDHRSKGSVLVAVFGPLVAWLAIGLGGVWLAHRAGAPTTAALGFLGGLPGGFLMGLGFNGLRRARAV